MGDVHFKDYSDTFKFALYIQPSDPDFDILDNKYVELVPYEVTKNWEVKVNRELVLRKCNQEELEYIFGEWKEGNKESVCFDGESGIRIKGNWINHKDYRVQHFTL